MIFSQCKRCEPNQVGSFTFTQDELRINPYSGNEILIFKELNGYTIYFPPGVRKTENWRGYEYDYETAKIYHNGCQGDFYDSQNDWMEKIDSSDKSRFDITLQFRYTMNKPSYDKGFMMYFWIKVPKLYCFLGHFNFEVDTLLNYKNKSSSSYSSDSVVAFHTTWEVGPKVFNNVYELFCKNPDSRDTAWISTAYYCLKEGLVGFKTTFGRTWYLNEIN